MEPEVGYSLTHAKTALEDDTVLGRSLLYFSRILPSREGTILVTRR